ncbi:precorrin-2 C(20)-methyltransferase [Chelatococcus asaccharovorans]|uniref:Precorrin-2/cobalt-factor-2 C20-methyltransferase n=1 Tax=Chelatococcus asaccharovorans TaxID=28210 RepID=A0A2V3U027_9HYPH|nr:precorrin-2 C(20)-methyltransferase [Chelatococcus asaccharovorans]MBS7704464.1 precorrin-2 C(20)-methyltransferase [Chelatococcus asaccharovorans]PXW55655.1 precorrin-2/cobalt-factor-2 C20-methyltransferase [Chelatococcus asaccharovorans]
MSLPPIRSGTLYGVGLGPGEPDYMTLRAARVIADADIIAFFAKRGRPGHARTIAAELIGAGRREMPLIYPMTTEMPADSDAYRTSLAAFYEESVATLVAELCRGASVAVLCEGDPFFYGSFMHLWRRLYGRWPVEVVPGVSGMSGGWTRAAAPITWGDDILTVLPATLPEEALATRLAATDAAVIMKLGRHLPKVRRALETAGIADRAIYVERATMADERIMPLTALAGDDAPYFAMVIVPGEGRRP